MNAALALLGYALIVSTMGAWMLGRAAWPRRAPGLAVATWQALSVSVVASVALAGLVLMVPTVPVTTDLAELLKTCVVTLQAMYATPGGIAVGLTGALVVGGVLGRVGYCLADELTRARRQRDYQRRLLALIAHQDDELGAMVVDHDSAAAYCLPGRRGRIVFTSAAVSALSNTERAATLAHEIAHLRGRHHLVIAAAQAMERAFPRVPLFRRAASEIAELVEMLADDAAARRYDRLTVAAALLSMAEMETPAGALAAGGGTSARRVRRMIENPARLGRFTKAAATLALAGVLALPLGIAAAPAIAATMLDYCPLIFDTTA